MDTLVKYPPQNPGEYANVELYALELIPVRIVVNRRVDGWCAYLLLKRMPIDYYLAYGDNPTEPTTFDRVRFNGDKIPERYARDLFPDFDDVPYAR